LNRPHPFQLLALIPLLLAPLAACSPAALQEGSADIAVSAQALSTSEVAKVTLTVSAADISPNIVANLQNTGGQWRAVIGAIPVGSNRTFLAQAFNSSNDKVYEGQATGVTISSGTTAAVVILLQQSTPPTPFVNSAPKVTGLTASTDRVGLNESLTLAVTDSDADGDPRSYAWTATGGTFANGNTASPTWTAPATEGTYTLSVSVTDGKGGQAGISLKLAVVQARGAANVAVSFNAWPVATQVTGTPSGQVAPGGVVSLDVAAMDPDNDALTYSWADDCGGSFSGTKVKSPTWTAPASASTGAVCKVRVDLNDGRGGSTTGQLGINLGLPQIPTMPPVINELFQSTDTVALDGTVNLVVSAHDPEGTAITFTWSASGGTLGTPVTSASRSEVVWMAPAAGSSSTITLVIQDESGQKTTQAFPINLTGETVTCVKVVTSYLKEVNPYGSPFTVNYSMVGGGGGGTGYHFGGNGATATGSFTLGTGNLEVFVGGGGGWGAYYLWGCGGGGAGYFGGGAGNSHGGGGGGSSAIFNANELVDVAAGGGGALRGGGGGSTTGGTSGYESNPSGAGTLGAGGHCDQASGGIGLNGGTVFGPYAGAGGGYGGGGATAAVGGTAGGTAGNSENSGGLGASTWSTATTLPAEAGAGSGGGGNAGLVILTYNALRCML
jgi:hypothetical protein